MGMFDTVHYNCPTCGSANEYQSKMGGCTLTDYYLDGSKIPIMVLADVVDQSEKGELYCELCGNQVKVKLQACYHVTCQASYDLTQLDYGD